MISSEQINTLTRACLMAADGKILVWGDYSAVEARANAWMAGDIAAVEGFRLNRDPYMALASRVYGSPVTDKKDPRRKVGKAGELALGYGQGVGGEKNPRRGKGYGKPYGFWGYGQKNGVDWDEMAKAKPPITAKTVVTMWRELHAPIVQLWKALERGMLQAFAGRENEVGVGCKVQWSRWNDHIVCTDLSLSARGQGRVWAAAHLRGRQGPRGYLRREAVRERDPGNLSRLLGRGGSQGRSRGNGSPPHRPR